MGVNPNGKVSMIFCLSCQIPGVYIMSHAHISTPVYYGLKSAKCINHAVIPLLAYSITKNTFLWTHNKED